MIKKISALIGSIIFALLLPVQVFAANNASLGLSPSTNTYNRGCSFSLDILLNTDGADTDGTDVKLDYDPAVLTATSITPGSIYPDYPSKSIDSTNGVISISGLSSVDKPFNGSGTFATVNFTVPSTVNTGTTQVKFEFDPNNLNNTKDSNVVQSGQVVDILRSVTNGTYTISTGACSGSGAGSITPTAAPIIGGTTGGTGGVTGGGTLPSSTPPSLPSSGASTPTIIMAIGGTLLVLGGILGLALL